MLLRTVLGASHPSWGRHATGNMPCKGPGWKRWVWEAAQLSKGVIKWASWQGLSRMVAGFLPGTDWKTEMEHQVVCRGMFRKKRMMQKPVVTLILTKANAQVAWKGWSCK